MSDVCVRLAVGASVGFVDRVPDTERHHLHLWTGECRVGFCVCRWRAHGVPEAVSRALLTCPLYFVYQQVSDTDDISNFPWPAVDMTTLQVCAVLVGC